MAMVRKRGNKYELRIKHKLLPNGIYTTTFASENEAHAYGSHLEISSRPTCLSAFSD